MKVMEFREQINKGLGSVILYLKDNQIKSHKYYKAILYACTHNTCYDPQCENERSQYLWEIMKLTSDFDNLQHDVLDNLFFAKDWDLLQIYRIAKLSALNGNLVAFEQMKKAFKYDESWNSFLGAEEIIEVDGIQGLFFVTEVIGMKLFSDEEYIETNSILEFTYDILGKDYVLNELEKASKSNIYIKTYINSVNQLLAEREDYYKNRQEYSYKQIKQIINGEINTHKIVLMNWGKSASEDELIKISNEFLKEIDKEKLIAYLWIFRKRMFPLKCEKILELAKSKNKEISYSAISALSNISDKQIHDLATKIILKKSNDYDFLDLFIKNYAEDDYILLESVFFEKHNKYTFHGMGMSLLDIYEANKTPFCLNMMVELYRNSRCSHCRQRCIKILLEINIIPDWILTEAEYDCNLDIREMITDYKKS